MTIDDKAREVNAYVQAALDGVLFALQGVHQAAVEKPVDAASRFGFPAEKAALIKDSHRRFVGSVYGGIRKAQHGLGDVAVEQVSELRSLAKALMSSVNAQTAGSASPSASSKKPVQRKRSAAKKVTKKVTKKAAKKTAKKSAKKVAKKTKKKAKKRAKKTAS
jgi:nicotinate-nucleotide pyrophosphorylase